jgi:excisionase family DNA binding protein
MTIIDMIESGKNALTVEQLANKVSKSPKTLYKAIKAGRLPAYRIGGSIRLDPHDVAEWLRKRRTV